MFFDHLLKVNCFRAGSCDQEVYSRMYFAYPGDCCDEKVGAFVVEETGDDNDCDVVL